MKRHEVEPAAKLEQEIQEKELDLADALKAGHRDHAARLVRQLATLEAKRQRTPPWRAGNG